MKHNISDAAGLEVGDNIKEVNSVSFDSIASSSAVKVLTGSNRLKLVVRRLGKIPGFKSAKEKTSWWDIFSLLYASVPWKIKVDCLLMKGLGMTSVMIISLQFLHLFMGEDDYQP